MRTAAGFITLRSRPMLYLVDGFNFLHAVLLVGSERPHWWSRDNQQRVVDWCVASGLTRGGSEIWVVFDQRDGREQAGSAGGLLIDGEGVHVRHAPDADDYIVARCSELCGQREVVVVSADRSLVDRAKHRGARAASPWSLAARNPLAALASWRLKSEVIMRETSDEERFVRLEEKAAHLEKLALDLNEVVIEQGQALDELLARLERLERQQRAGEDDPSIPHEKPPHY